MKECWESSVLGQSIGQVCVEVHVNCHPSLSLKTQYLAVSFCQSPDIYITTAKKQQEFCKLACRNVYRERIHFQSLGLWNGYLDDFDLQKNWKKYRQNSFCLHTIFFVLFWFFQIFTYLWPLETWFICLLDPFPELSSVLWFFSLQLNPSVQQLLNFEGIFFEVWMKYQFTEKEIKELFWPLLHLFNRN